MPIFDYRCDDCGHKFEKLVFSKGEEPDYCPICETQSPTKLMSIPAPPAGQPSSTTSNACPCGEKQGTGFS